jgi:hypothetical protein
MSSKEKKMANYKYNNKFQISVPDEDAANVRKEANKRKISNADVIRIAIAKYFEWELKNKPETPNEKNNNGNEQDQRNDGKREHLYF